MKTTATEPEAIKRQKGEKVPPPPGPTSVEGLEAVTTESGLKYWDIKVGKGEQVLAGATVTFQFTGWLADGTVIDTTFGKEKPAKVRLGRLIKGLTEGMSSMHVGGKRLLEIPPKLAYGDKGGVGGTVPPNATVLYEVELVGVKQQPQPTSVEGLTPVTTASGLKYYDFKVGDGAQPWPTGKVLIRYGAWVAGGAMLRSTLERPDPVPMSLQGVCDGWAEGIGSMKVGGKRQIHVPPELGLGKKGRHNVPPNASLIFEVELFDIIPPPHMEAIAGITPVTTASGLKYWDVTVGDGSTPDPPESTVELRYTGWRSDGTMFDSSASRGGVVTVTFGQLIRGLQEGVGTMKVGGKRWMEIPPELGFPPSGEKARKVGPGETLLFEVELVDVGPPRHLLAIKGETPVTTASGLKYHDINVGAGPSPTPGSTVTIEYIGWLTDGTVFVSTIADSKPLTVGFDQVIPGLKEGLSSMRIGGKRWLEVPPHLGFGERGHPPNNVGPNETLIIEVELIGIE